MLDNIHKPESFWNLTFSVRVPVIQDDLTSLGDVFLQLFCCKQFLYVAQLKLHLYVCIPMITFPKNHVVRNVQCSESTQIFTYFIYLFILHVCHYKSTNTIYNYTTMMSHKDYINISHKYYDGWNDHTEIKSPITGFHKIH